jgi:hypothetical protein
VRLSDIAWWMRLLCENIAMRASHDDREIGKFWQRRCRAVRSLDESTLSASPSSWTSAARAPQSPRALSGASSWRQNVRFNRYRFRPTRPKLCLPEISLLNLLCAQHPRTELLWSGSLRPVPADTRRANRNHRRAPSNSPRFGKPPHRVFSMKSAVPKRVPSPGQSHLIVGTIRKGFPKSTGLTECLRDRFPHGGCCDVWKPD